jgi:hypothetical protein
MPSDAANLIAEFGLSTCDALMIDGFLLGRNAWLSQLS